VRAVAFPPQIRPTIVATGGMEKKLRVYDLNQSTNGASNVENSTAPSFEIGPGEHEGTIRSVIWTPDPNVLVTGSEDKKIRWWDMRARSSITSFTVDGTLGTCEMDAIGIKDGSATLSVAAGKSVYFFDSDKPGELIKKVETKYDIASVSVNGKSGKFVTGSPSDTWVRVWDFETGTETGELIW
jgi:serine-threonine kinase receptor-associated protein